MLFAKKNIQDICLCSLPKNTRYHNKQALGQICQLLTSPTQLSAAEIIV